MREGLVAHYARMADQAEWGYHTYGGDAGVAALRAFQRYHPLAHVDFVDIHGERHWMTRKQARIHAILQRQAQIGGLITMRAIASEALVTPGTVSRFVLKVQAWGWYGAIIVRGRNGGMYVFARAIGDTLAHYAQAAKDRIMGAIVRREARRIRKGVNVASIESRGDVYTDATFMATQQLTRFARAVLRERARLAIVDPEGERDAAYPVDEEKAYQLYGLYQPLPSGEIRGGELAEALGIPRDREKGNVTCPAHGQGRNKALSYRWTAGGGLLLHCFAGCTFTEIKAAC